LGSPRVTLRGRAGVRFLVFAFLLRFDRPFVRFALAMAALPPVDPRIPVAAAL